jgi:hypothetical protein
MQWCVQLVVLVARTRVWFNAEYSNCVGIDE